MVLSPMLLTKLDWEEPEPLPEPLAALALYWKVMLVIGTSMERSAPSTLGVSCRLWMESHTVVW